MDNATKLALHDPFVAYLLESSLSMADTIQFLALDPLNSSRVDLLNDSLDTAKFLLTQVWSFRLLYILLI